MSIDSDIEAIGCALACLRRVGSSKDRPARRDPAIQAVIDVAVKKLSIAQSLLIKSSIDPVDIAKMASEASTMPIPVIKDGDVNKCPNCGDVVAARFEHEAVAPYDGKGTRTYWKCQTKVAAATNEILTIDHLTPKAFDSKKARMLAVHFKHHTGADQGQAQLDAAEQLELAADAFDKLKALPLGGTPHLKIVDVPSPVKVARSGMINVELSESGNLSIEQDRPHSSIGTSILIQRGDVVDFLCCLEKIDLIVGVDLLLTTAEVFSIQTALEAAQQSGLMSAEDEARLSAALDRVGK